MAATWLEEVEDRARSARPMCADRHEVEVIGPGVVRIACGSRISTYESAEPAALDEADHLIDQHLRETDAQTILDLVERVRAAEATVAKQHNVISQLRAQLREVARRESW